MSIVPWLDMSLACKNSTIFPWGQMKDQKQDSEIEMVRKRKGSGIFLLFLSHNQNSQKIKVGEDSRHWGERGSGLVITLVLGVPSLSIINNVAVQNGGREYANLASAGTLAPGGKSPAPSTLESTLGNDFSSTAFLPDGQHFPPHSQSPILT